MPRHRFDIPLLPPPPGTIGGHSPRTTAKSYADLQDLARMGAAWSSLKNLDPLRVPGSFTQRRAIAEARARAGGDTDRIVNLAYQPSARKDLTSIYDTLWIQLDSNQTAGEVTARVVEYLRGQDILYDASNWQDTDIGTTPVPGICAESTGSKHIFQGTGLWLPSVLGYLRMAQGPELRVSGPTVPMKGMYVDRQGGAPYYDGFFYQPNEEEGAREVTKTGYKIIPEKPWTNLGAPWEIRIDPILIYGELENDYLPEQTGYCWGGFYTFWVVPVDQDGEEGPPIIQQNFNLSFDIITIPGAGSALARGCSLLLRVDGIDDTVLRSDLRALRLYGKYRNPAPTSAGWTATREDIATSGFGLFAAPLDVPACLVAEWDLNGRQFDPMGEEFIGAALRDLDNDLTRSERFHYFPNPGDPTTGWLQEAVRVDGGGAAPYGDDYIDINRRDYISPFMFTYPLDTSTWGVDDRVCIEIEGLAGVFHVSNIASVSNGQTMRLTLVESIPWDRTEWPLLPENAKKIRFCFPWHKRSSDNTYQINEWIWNPELWDQSRPLEWPEDSNELYNAGYPHYAGHCESPSGRRRLCWNFTYALNETEAETETFSGTGSQTVFTLAKSFVSGGYSEVYVGGVLMEWSTDYSISGTTITFTSPPSSDTDNVQVTYETALSTNISDIETQTLMGTTNRQDGFFETKRFQLSIPVPDSITGAAFLTDEVFVVTSRDRAWIGEYYLDDAQWLMRLYDAELPYGNTARALAVNDRTVFGVDPKYGPWSLGVDPGRIRQDISPAGNQRLLMRIDQVSWFRDTYGNNQTIMDDVTVVATRDRVIVGLPKPTGSPTGESSQNIYRRAHSDSADNVWLTFYMRDGWGMWFLDYAKGATYTLPLYDLCIGPSGCPIAHTQGNALGDVMIFLDDDTSETDTLDSARAIEAEMATPLLQAPLFPARATMIEAYLRLQKEGSTPIETTLTVTPWRGEAAKTAFARSAITGAGWIRGIQRLGDSWEVKLTDMSNGIFRANGLILDILALAKRGGGPDS